MSNICRYYAATGSCYYGDQCNFLHTQFPPSSRSLPTSEGAAPGATSLYDLESTHSSHPLSFTHSFVNLLEAFFLSLSFVTNRVNPCHSEQKGHAKSQKPCRNIEIYGYCKFAGKGCDYNHDLVRIHFLSLPFSRRLISFSNLRRAARLPPLSVKIIPT